VEVREKLVNRLAKHVVDRERSKIIKLSNLSLKRVIKLETQLSSMVKESKFPTLLEET
jgi:hypothetical protein